MDECTENQGFQDRFAWSSKQSKIAQQRSLLDLCFSHNYSFKNRNRNTSRFCITIMLCSKFRFCISLWLRHSALEFNRFCVRAQSIRIRYDLCWLSMIAKHRFWHTLCSTRMPIKNIGQGFSICDCFLFSINQRVDFFKPKHIQNHLIVAKWSDEEHFFMLHIVQGKMKSGHTIFMAQASPICYCNTDELTE